MAAPIREGFNIQASIFVLPDMLDEFFAILEKIHKHTIAEPECLFFEAYQSADNPGHIRLVENWDATVEWFMTERIKKDYVQEYFSAVEPLLAKPREFQIYRRLQGFQTIKGHFAEN